MANSKKDIREKYEPILTILLEEKKLTEKRVSRNFYLQIITITIGVGILFDTNIFVTFFVKDWISFDDNTIKFVVPFVLQYFFMKFGYDLNGFISTRATFDSFFDVYIKGQRKKTKQGLRTSLRSRS